MEGSYKNRRKNYFIDKSFQVRFIVKFCTVIISMNLVIGVLVYMFNMQTATVAFENLSVVVKSTSDFILPTVLLILIITTSVSAFMTILVALFASHKIAGPMYSLQRQMGKIAKGNLVEPVHIRSEDQLQKTAEKMEFMRKQLKEKVDILKVDWDEAKKHIEKDKISAEFNKSMEKIERDLEEFIS